MQAAAAGRFKGDDTMKTKRNFLALMLSVCMAVLPLAGCGFDESGTVQSSTPSAFASTSASSLAATPGPSEPESPAQGQTATLYVGTREVGFAEYPLSYEGELTPEILIQGIADLTGWDLTLAEAVITGKGGMSWPMDEPYIWENGQ